MRLILAFVFAGLLSGCAGRDYYYQIPAYQTPRVIPDFYEAGEVVGVELVSPGRRVPYDCEYSGNGAYGYYGDGYSLCQYSPRIRDAVPLRGGDGRVNFVSGGGGHLLSRLAEASDIPDDTISLEAEKAGGWRIYNTVRLDSDQEITVVDSVDKGFAIGEPVRVGFKNSSFGWASNHVYLLGSDEEDVSEIIERREPPGPWGRINAQLEQELSLAERRPPGWPVPAAMLDEDPELLTEQELAVLEVSGSRLLGAMEDEYTDFTLGFRSEEDLREPIEVIFETNLGFGIREAWKDYEKHAIPEFAAWFESNFPLE